MEAYSTVASSAAAAGASARSRAAAAGAGSARPRRRPGDLASGDDAPPLCASLRNSVTGAGDDLGAPRADGLRDRERQLADAPSMPMKTGPACWFRAALAWISRTAPSGSHGSGPPRRGWGTAERREMR